MQRLLIDPFKGISAVPKRLKNSNVVQCLNFGGDIIDFVVVY